MRRASMNRPAALLGAVVLLLWGFPGLAQVGPQYVRTSRERSSDTPVELRLLGGVQSFTAGLSAGTGMGPLVGVSFSAQPLLPVGWELAYEASRLPVNGDGLPGGAALWSHTVLGLVKLGVPVTAGLRPFVATGLGVAYLHPSHEVKGPYASDVFLELPFAVGLDARVGALSGGVLLSYRSVIAEDFDHSGQGDASGGLLTAGLSLGIGF